MTWNRTIRSLAISGVSLDWPLLAEVGLSLSHLVLRYFQAVSSLWCELD